MNRKHLFWPLAAVLLTACEKGLDDGGDYMSPTATGQVTNSVLQVRTRSGGAAADEATVAYPVQVYVFQGDECQAAQTIGDAGQTLNIALVEGTYSVYAIGGASTADYVLPTVDDATVTSVLTLKDGKAHGDLMAATATATLVDGGTNTVTLGMTRKTMLIQCVEIKQVPTAATAVSVTIAPPWEGAVCGRQLRHRWLQHHHRADEAERQPHVDSRRRNRQARTAHQQSARQRIGEHHRWRRDQDLHLLV